VVLTQITQALYIMAQLIFVMLLLAIIGRPLFFIFKRHIEFLGNFSLTQEIVFDIYFGTLFLYVLALIPLHLFKRAHCLN